MNKLKEEGERFLDIVQVSMLKHLKDGLDDAKEHLRQTTPPADGDGDAIYKQAQALLCKNFDRKRCGYTSGERVHSPLHRQQKETGATTTTQPPNDINNDDDEDGDDDEIAFNAPATNGLPADTDSTNVPLTASAVGDNDTEPEDDATYIRPSRLVTRSRKLSTHQAKQGEVLVDQTKNVKSKKKP